MIAKVLFYIGIFFHLAQCLPVLFSPWDTYLRCHGLEGASLEFVGGEPSKVMLIDQLLLVAITEAALVLGLLSIGHSKMGFMLSLLVDVPQYILYGNFVRDMDMHMSSENPFLTKALGSLRYLALVPVATSVLGMLFQCKGKETIARCGSSVSSALLRLFVIIAAADSLGLFGFREELLQVLLPQEYSTLVLEANPPVRTQWLFFTTKGYYQLFVFTLTMTLLKPTWVALLLSFIAYGGLAGRTFLLHQWKPSLAQAMLPLRGTHALFALLCLFSMITLPRASAKLKEKKA